MSKVFSGLLGMGQMKIDGHCAGRLSRQEWVEIQLSIQRDGSETTESNCSMALLGTMRMAEVGNSDQKRRVV